ncbi:aspartate aminotransferase family protein [Candidatus Gracilibacteria bacterium]|nr:aspartate aminotransferase family protein [Candidatus Gracilibacteria bacterium]
MSQIFETDQQYLMPGIQQIASRSQLVIERGEGAILWDEQSKSYIDLFAGVGVCSIGHSHPRFVATITEQLNKVIVGSFSTKVRAEFGELLASVTPENMDRYQLFSCGSEAVEAALRLARSYTKKSNFLSFWGGFHGKTWGALGLCGVDFKNDYQPMPPGYTKVPYAECYHCPFNLTYPECKLACVDFARKTIEQELKGNLAAIVVEPMQGTNGNVIPPAPFLPALRQLANDFNALLIVDEIITGFGRTGQMFASNSLDTNPDVIVVGKGMANGLPISGLISNDELSSAEPFAKPSGSSSSFGGNPIVSAAALATLQVILDENLVENSQKIGSWFLQELQKFQERYPFIGNVQGKGLTIGIELNREGDRDRPLEKEITNEIFDRMIRAGIIMMCYSAKIRINPPLCISQELGEKSLVAMQAVFDSIANDYF